MLALAALILAIVAMALLLALAVHVRRLEEQLRSVREEIAAQRAFGPSPWMSPAPDWLRPRETQAEDGVTAESGAQAFAGADTVFPLPNRRAWPLDPSPAATPPPTFPPDLEDPPAARTAPETPRPLPAPPAVPRIAHGLPRGAWRKIIAVCAVLAALVFAVTFVEPLAPLAMAALACVGLVGVALAVFGGDDPQSSAGPIGLIAAAGAGVSLLAAMAEAGPLSPAGVGVTALIVAAACGGAARERLEPMLIAAWIATCAALWLLSGETAAAAWLTPACALSGALFWALAAAQPARLARSGLTLAALSALAPFVAIYLLSGEGQPLAAPGWRSAAYALAAVLIAAALWAAARTSAGLKHLGWTAWPLLAGVLAGAALAGVTLAPAVWEGAVWAALALALAGASRLTRHRAFATFAALFAVAALIAAARVLFETAATALSVPAAAVVAGVLFGASRVAPQRLSSALEAPAALSGLAAIAAGVAPELFALRLPAFAQLGLLSTLGLTLALGLRLAARYANPGLRSALAWALVVISCLGLGLALGYPQNPWWGARPALTAPWHLLIAAFAPALALAAHAALSARRGERGLSVLIAACAGLCAALGALMALRLAFHDGGWGQGLAPGELLASTAVLLAAGVTLLAIGWRRLDARALRWTGAGLLAAGAAKFVAADAVVAGWIAAPAAAGLCLAGLAFVMLRRSAVRAFMRRA